MSSHYIEPPTSLYNYPPSSDDSHYSKIGFTDSESQLSRHELLRTPSPTPSEALELQRAGPFDWKRIFNWRFWIRKEWFWYYVILIVVTVVGVLVSLYHKEIVRVLTPAANWMHNLRYGWAIPVGILFVISFPPLFGHEIVAILCGLVWGLWLGFGIVALGTFLGEVGNFYAFKYCCRARGEKLEKTNFQYALLAKVVREGGFKIALIARLSAIPGHFTTAVFSACGMGIIVFSIAAILSLPKQFITVYVGVVLEQSETGVKDPKTNLISNIALIVTLLITVLAMWYIYYAMGKAKPAVIYERRKARQGKMARRGDLITQVESWVDNNLSEVHIPLKATARKKDKDGFTLQEAQLYAPQPQKLAPPIGSYLNSSTDSVSGQTKIPQSEPSSSSETIYPNNPVPPPGLSPAPVSSARMDGYQALPAPSSHNPTQAQGAPWHVPAASTDITDGHSGLPYDASPTISSYPNLPNPFTPASPSLHHEDPTNIAYNTAMSGQPRYAPVVSNPPTPF